VAAAAVGLILATILQVARKSLSRLDDLVFVALTVLLVNQLHVPVARVLIVVGSISIVRSRIGARKGSAQG
jgi:chromate transport protein ChrA